MNIALLSRQTLHTEVMGFLIPILHEMGHQISLFYNTTDPWHMIDYYKERYPYLHETGEWMTVFHKPVDTYDRIILITSDEWNIMRYRRYINAWNNASKLMVIHHDTCYLSRYPQFQRYIGFMACYGPDHTVFPLYEKPVRKDICVSNISTIPPLVCVGSLDSKDQEDVARYIDVGGKVVNYVRYPATVLMERHGDSFECVANLGGVDLMTALEKRIGNGRGHMWFPIKQDTGYATDKFSGSLVLGADVGAVLVMPDILRRSLSIPEGAVITYIVSVTEPATLSALRESARDPRPWLEAFHVWKCQQWDNTMRIVTMLLK